MPRQYCTSALDHRECTSRSAKTHMYMCWIRPRTSVGSSSTVPREIVLAWFVFSHLSTHQNPFVRSSLEIRFFFVGILSRAPVRSRVLIRRPICLFVCVQASWLRMAYQVELSPLSFVVHGQAHLCSSGGMYQLQPWYVHGDSRPYIKTSCAPRYMDLPCTDGTKPAQSTCARSLCCRGSVTRSACF